MDDYGFDIVPASISDDDDYAQNSLDDATLRVEDGEIKRIT